IVRLGRRHDVDDVDVGATDQRLPIVGRLGNAEVFGVRIRPRPIDVADANDLAARIALPPWDVGIARPRACPQDPDPQRARHDAPRAEGSYATRLLGAELRARCTVNRLPSPGVLSTSTLPPIASDSSLTSASPSPAPERPPSSARPR